MPVKLFATPDQIQVINCKARYIGLFAGRRWGKTIGVIVPRIIKTAIEVGSSNCAYIAPTHKLCRFIFDMISQHCHSLIKRTNAQFPFFIQFWNGSRIDFYSFGRPKAIRGSGYDFVVMDEIQEIRESELFWAVIRPLVSDRHGTILVAGQFRGKNWYYQFFVKDAGLDYTNNSWIKTEHNPLRKAFIFPASTGATYQDAKGKADLEDAKKSFPRVIYEQEWECFPTANAAAVFHPDDLMACQQGEILSDPRAGQRYLAGIDLGAHRDQGAVVILEVPSGQVVQAIGLPLGQRHQQLAMQVRQVVSRFKALPIVDVTGGATGGKAPVDTFIKFYREQMPDMRPYEWRRDNKQHAIRLLSSMIEQHKIGIPKSCIQLHEELGLYEYEYKSWGYDYHGPSGSKDNLVAALALAVDGWSRGWSPEAKGRELSAAFI